MINSINLLVQIINLFYIMIVKNNKDQKEHFPPPEIKIKIILIPSKYMKVLYMIKILKKIMWIVVCKSIHHV